MPCSVFDLFRIGIGPSSSHTMGPMRAAAAFADALIEAGCFEATAAIAVDLYGSLALTGRGHATDRAVLLGLAGCLPETVDPDAADRRAADVVAAGSLLLAGRHPVSFDPGRHIRFHCGENMPAHPNGLRFSASDAGGRLLLARGYYSIGGGAIVAAEAMGANRAADGMDGAPFPFRSGADLVAMAEAAGLSIGALALKNETAFQPEPVVLERLATIADVMERVIERGITQNGILPGGLHVRRRAAATHARLVARQERALSDPLSILDWVNLWALAVNEENAAGGRVVTAPTNGAAGIIPAVLRYYRRCIAGASPSGVAEFLLVAGAIGALFKENASISGAEVGCQGEVGVACSMAAAGLASVLGGSPAQIENAAEIAMEHNLGLTCDPVGGLVQVPCIERNAVGAVKAIEAARLALLGDGTHRVSLDQVIATMRATGRDMLDRYKETALGGLAVNVVEC